MPISGWGRKSNFTINCFMYRVEGFAGETETRRCGLVEGSVEFEENVGGESWENNTFSFWKRVRWSSYLHHRSQYLLSVFLKSDCKACHLLLKASIFRLRFGLHIVLGSQGGFPALKDLKVDGESLRPVNLLSGGWIFGKWGDVVFIFLGVK